MYTKSAVSELYELAQTTPNPIETPEFHEFHDFRVIHRTPRVRGVLLNLDPHTCWTGELSVKINEGTFNRESYVETLSLEGMTKAELKSFLAQIMLEFLRENVLGSQEKPTNVQLDTVRPKPSTLGERLEAFIARKSPGIGYSKHQKEAMEVRNLALSDKLIPRLWDIEKQKRIKKDLEEDLISFN